MNATAVYHLPQASRVAAFEAVEKANREADRLRRERLYGGSKKVVSAQWAVVPQVVTVEGEERLALCRRVGRGATEDKETGKLKTFQLTYENRDGVKVPYAIYVVVVRDLESGTELTLKISGYGGTPTFTAAWPQVLTHRTIQVRGRKYPDTISPKVWKDGQILSWLQMDDFDAWMKGKFGNELAKRVWGLFSQGQNGGKHVLEAA